MIGQPERATFFANWPKLLAAAIVIWGGLIALGTYLRYRDFGKPAVILLSALLFAAFWLIATRKLPTRRS